MARSRTLVGAVAGCVAAALLSGCGGTSEGVQSVEFVRTETDAAGRVQFTYVDVEYMVETGKRNARCTVLFYDEDGNKLLAPNSSLSPRGDRRRPYDPGRGRRTETYVYQQEIQVGGIPHTAKLDC